MLASMGISLLYAITKYVKLLRVEYSFAQREHTVLQTLKLVMGITYS
jgi:hypothetical protein